MSLTSSPSGNRSRRSGSRRYDGSGSSLTPRHSLLKPRRLQSAYFDDKQGVSKCRNCGWIYPHASPGARERREHKKHCHDTLKVQRWLAFEDFHDYHKGLREAGNEQVDDGQKAVSDRVKQPLTAAQNIDGPEGAGDVGRERKKKPLLSKGNDGNSDGRRTESGTEHAPSAPVGNAAEKGTNEKGKEARDSENLVQDDDLARTKGPQGVDETGKTLLRGVPQIRGSHLDSSGVESSKLVTASEDAEVHDLGRIDNVNKLQEEKQAGSGSLQDTTGMSNKEAYSWKGRHGTEDRKERIGRDDQSNYNDDEPTQPETLAGTLNKRKESANLTLAAKNWQDWEDVVREENRARHGIRDEAGESKKTAFSDVDTEKIQNEVTNPVAIPGPKHGSDKPGRKSIKQSLAERNWDDWDDVILQSSKLWSLKDSTEGTSTFPRNLDKSGNRAESDYALETRQRNEHSKQATPDLVPRPSGDDSTAMLEGRERILVAYEVPVGVDGHLSEHIALWKTRDHKGFFTFRALSSNEADDVGVLSSRSRSRRRIRTSFEWPPSFNGRNAEVQTRSIIPDFATGCFYFRPAGNSSFGRSMSEGADGENTLVLVPAPDIALGHRHPAASIHYGKTKLEDSSVSRRRDLFRGDIGGKQSLVQRSSSAPLAICEDTTLGLRSWKSNFLRLLRNQTKYSIICPRCESFIINKMKMRKKRRRYIYNRSSRVTDELEIRTNLSEISPLSETGKVSACGVDNDDWQSTSDLPSSEM